VIVAVVDTGILSRHPDLSGQLVAGYDFVRDFTSAGDGDGIDPDPEDPGNRSDPGASSYHGTHVAGTIAAAGDNGTGVAGVAWVTRIMALRALDGSGGGTSYDVNQAIRFAAALPNDSGTVPDQPADIINLSLGGAAFSQIDQDLVDQVRAAGIQVVAAAGNGATSLPAYPASYDGVISVSAVDAQRRLTRYSNTGATVDIAAPGGDNSVDLNGDGYPDGVLSTGGIGAGAATDFAYTFLNGTSMASPHVAGVLALMKSVNPELNPEDIDALLGRGDLTDDLGPAGRDDQYGHGLVNAQSAVLAAIEAGGSSPANEPRLVSSASALNFGTAADSLTLELRNGGQGTLELLSLVTTADWLSLSPQQVGDDNLGTYLVTVDRSGLDEGIYSADIRAESSFNNLSIRILLSVGGADETADVGLVYILLYDLDQEDSLAQVATESSGGLYRYRFDRVPPGRYQIIAGTDADNDLFICDSGEACGAWLTTDRPLVLEPEADLSDIDFPIEYLVSLPSATAEGLRVDLERQREDAVAKQR
jgi:serine protease